MRPTSHGGKDTISVVTVPLDAMREFVHRNDETKPFNVKDGKTVAKIFKRLLKETESAPVVRTDHMFYKELIGFGKQIGETFVAVLLRELQDRRDTLRDGRALWYCIAALHEITEDTPEVPDYDRHEVAKVRTAWLHWGAQKGLAW